MNTQTLGPEQATLPTPPAPAASAAGQFLIFYLGREEYGIQVPRIREIISLVPLQLAPGLPYCVRGVIHILGKKIPVIDLRLKLGLAATGPGRRRPKKDPDATWLAEEGPADGFGPGRHPEEGQIVVIETGEKQAPVRLAGQGSPGGTSLYRSLADLSGEYSYLGVAVDCISEIACFRPEDIEPAASAGGRPALNCVLGQVKAGRNTRTLLDIDLALNLDYLPDFAVSRTLATE